MPPEKGWVFMVDVLIVEENWKMVIKSLLNFV